VSRFRGLPAVLVVLLGGAGVALGVGFVAYLLRSRNRPPPGADEGYEGWADPIDLAETQAAEEAALEYAQALPAPEPFPHPVEKPVEQRLAAASAGRAVGGSEIPRMQAVPRPHPAPEQKPPVERRLVTVLVLAAILLGVAVGLVIFMASGGRLG
jgi:hypothetical protein